MGKPSRCYHTVRSPSKCFFWNGPFQWFRQPKKGIPNYQEKPWSWDWFYRTLKQRPTFKCVL